MLLILIFSHKGSFFRASGKFFSKIFLRFRAIEEKEHEAPLLPSFKIALPSDDEISVLSERTEYAARADLDKVIKDMQLKTIENEKAFKDAHSETKLVKQTINTEMQHIRALTKANERKLASLGEDRADMEKLASENKRLKTDVAFWRSKCTDLEARITSLESLAKNFTSIDKRVAALETTNVRLRSAFQRGRGRRL